MMRCTDLCLLYFTQLQAAGDGFSSCVFTFWPRDAMHKRGLCRHAVCLCVCVSVTFVDHAV